jgi:hypothetical protein
MSFRREWIIALSWLAVVGIVVFLFWTTLAIQTGIHLKTIGQAIKQGRQVVFFRVEGAENYSIFNVSHNEAGLPDYAFVEVKPDAFIAVGPRANDFGIVAPTGLLVWKLNLVLRKEDVHSWAQARIILSRWRFLLQTRNRWSIVRSLWNQPVVRFHSVESQPITNEPPSNLRSSLQPEK